MCPSEHAKRPYLTTVADVLLAFVLSAPTLSVEPVYAEEDGLYRPNYIWVEQARQKATSEFVPFTPINDAVDMYRQYAGNNLESATLENWKIKALKATGHDIARIFIEQFPLFSPTSLEEGTVRIINPNTSMAEKTVGSLQIAKEFIPLATKYGERKLIQRNLDKYITEGTLKTSNIAVTKGLKLMNAIGHTESGVGLGRELFLKNQDHMRWFRTPRSSMPAVSQREPDRLLVAPSRLTSPVTSPILQTPDFAKYQNSLTRIDTSLMNRYIDPISISPSLSQPDYSFNNQVPAFSRYQSTASQVDISRLDSRMEPVRLRTLPPSTIPREYSFSNQTPDFGKYQNNTPGQTDISQLNSRMEPVRLRTLPPPIVQRNYGLHNQTPLRMRGFESLHIEPIRVPPVHFGGGMSGGAGATGRW